MPTKRRFFDSFEREKADAVINCAAYTDVDGAETNIEQCYAANSIGVENLALAAKQIDCGFCHDFDRLCFRRRENRFLHAARHAESAGRLRRSETRRRNSGAKRLRAFDHRPFGLDLRRGRHEFFERRCIICSPKEKPSKRFPTLTARRLLPNDLAKRLRELAETRFARAFFTLRMRATGTSYAGFARKVCEMKGFDVNLLEPVSADTLKRPAPRPQSSKLACLFSEKFGSFALAKLGKSRSKSF